MKILINILFVLLLGIAFYSIETFEYRYLKEILFLFSLTLIALVYRQRVLEKNNEKLKKLQETLIELNYNLQTNVLSVNHDLERAQEIAKLGSWVLDIPRNDLRWSKETYLIFDIDPDTKSSELYDAFIKRVHPDDKAELEKIYERSLKNQVSYRHEHRILMDDGSIKYIQENCETSFDDEKMPLVSYGTVQDITEATIVKMEIKEKDLQLLHKSRLAQMGEMLSMIAHQWKQPLGSISAIGISMQMAIDLKKYDLDDKSQRDEFVDFLEIKLEKISTHVRNLNDIISDFRDFYKPNKKSEIVVVDDVLRKSSTLFKDSISQEEIDLDFKLNCKDEIFVHENEFMQVILNIVINAKEQILDNKIESPKIAIKTYSSEDDIFVEISDNGGGIKEEILDKVFDPYFSTKLEKNGTGIGLYMSKTIIKDYHSGDIYAKNSKDGAIFTIKIKKYKRVEDEQK